MPKSASTVRTLCQGEMQEGGNSSGRLSIFLFDPHSQALLSRYSYNLRVIHRQTQHERKILMLPAEILKIIQLQPASAGRLLRNGVKRAETHFCVNGGGGNCVESDTAKNGF